MSFVENLKETFTSVLDQLGLAWWAEIVTEKPLCIYYFGPFVSVKEAEEAQAGYIEDIEQEEIPRIIVNIKRCQPKELTIFDEDVESFDSQMSPAISQLEQVSNR